MYYILVILVTRADSHGQNMMIMLWHGMIMMILTRHGMIMVIHTRHGMIMVIHTRHGMIMVIHTRHGMIMVRSCHGLPEIWHDHGMVTMVIIIT